MSSSELIRVYVSPSTITEWMECEVASWEDQQLAREGGGIPENREPVGEHIYEILDAQPAKTVIRLTPADARRAIRSLEYQGTGCGWDERSPSFMKALDRIAKELREGLPNVYFEPHPDIPLALIEEVAKRHNYVSVQETPDEVIISFNSEADAENYICACDGDERFLTPAIVQGD